MLRCLGHTCTSPCTGYLPKVSSFYLVYRSRVTVYFLVHTCALLALLNAEKRLMIQTSQHAAKRDVPVLSTAIRIDMDLLPSSELGIPDSLMGVGTPSSSSAQLITEVPRNSYDLGTSGGLYESYFGVPTNHQTQRVYD